MSDKKTLEQIKNEINPYFLRSDIHGIVWNEGFDASTAIHKEKIEKLTRQVEILKKALKFECGNRCAEQNPCNAKEALKQCEGIE